MQCIGIALLMISIVVQHWDCIAYKKHSRAMHWDALLMISIVVQCNRIK